MRAMMRAATAALLVGLRRPWCATAFQAFVRTGPSVVTTQASSMATSDNNHSSNRKYDCALLFDCDGVILETEELHRRAYNAAFAQFGLRHSAGEEQGQPVEWTVEYYDVLQNTVGGGKPKMWHYFTQTMGDVWPLQKRSDNNDSEDNVQSPPPATRDEQQALIDALQEWKTQHYKELLQTSAVPRPGVLALLDEALADPTVAVGVCSAATKEAAAQTLALTLGDARVQQLDVCLLGDDVAAKKPNPLIYVTAAERLGVPPSRCVVVEDSLIGLQAAVAAGMPCIITYTSSTAHVDFYQHGAKAKMPHLQAGGGVTLEALLEPLRCEGPEAEEWLVNIRDER